MEKLLNILPIIIMLESFAASIPLFMCRQWGSGLYWFAAGLLNFAVIFLVKNGDKQAGRLRCREVRRLNKAVTNMKKYNWIIIIMLFVLSTPLVFW